MARLDVNFYSTILKREVNFLLIYPSLACGDTNNYHRNYYKENKNNKFPSQILKILNKIKRIFPQITLKIPTVQ